MHHICSSTQAGTSADTSVIDGVPLIEGTPASILEEFRDCTFMDVACTRTAQASAAQSDSSSGATAAADKSREAVYCVTSSGVLCVFSK